MSVLIIGAGIAGLSCGYNLDFLSSGSIDLQILEARSKVGGRIQNVEGASFIDFDLDLGGQDLFFGDKYQLQGLISRGELDSWDTEDRPVSYTECESGEDCDANAPFYRATLEDASFVGKTLSNFITEILLPPVLDSVRLNTVVTSIDYTNPKKVVATTSDGIIYEADKLVVAVPISQLQKGAITFNPPLPDPYVDTIDGTQLRQGVRIFVEFSEKFYDDATKVDDVVYWDAARFKSGDKNIVTIQGNRCRSPNGNTCDMSEEEILEMLLNDLDKAYQEKGEKVATNSFVDAYFQDWSVEPYIEMVNREPEPDDTRNISIYMKPLFGRIWFVGDYTRAGSGNQAGESGLEVAQSICECKDDLTWAKVNRSGERVKSKKCRYVAKKPSRRCRLTGSSDGVEGKIAAWYACPETCGKCLCSSN